MNTYCPVRPRNRPMSVPTCSGVNATQSTTASNSRPPRAAATDAGSRMSPCRTVAPPGSGRCPVRPRFSTNSSMPRSAASHEHAELITPLPPMKRTRRPLTAHSLDSAPPALPGRVTGLPVPRLPGNRLQIGEHQVAVLVVGDVLGGSEGLVGAVPGLGGVPGHGVGAGQCLVGEGQVPVADAVLLADLQDPAGVVQGWLGPPE